MNEKYSPGFLKFIPGFLVLVGVGLFAFLISNFIVELNELILALILGALIGNSFGIPNWAKDGIDSYKLLLETGIVVMGGIIVLDQVVHVGPSILGLVLIFIIMTIVFVELFSNYLHSVSNKLLSLMAAGLSICGVSAIVTVAGSIKAKEEHVVYAIASIVIIDTISIISFPIIGKLLGLPDIIFGVWVGLSMFSTGPVIATGFAFSEEAGQWATLTKLTRNGFIGLVAVGYAIFYSNIHSKANLRLKNIIGNIWDVFPKFIIGFILLMILGNSGIASENDIQAINIIYKKFFLLAFVGLGMNIQFRNFRNAGVKPLVLVLMAFIILSILSLILVVIMIHGVFQ